VFVTPKDVLRFLDLPGRASADPFADAPDLPLSVRIVRMTYDPSRRPHRHPHSYELVHVVSGEGVAWADGERTPVAAGSTFFVPQGVPHATLPAPGSHLELVCFFPRPDLPSNLEELDGPVLGADA
jgi:quercetin dioxygenase-like cupin family protein